MPTVATHLTVEHLHTWMDRFAASVATHVDELTALDAAIGDADHGSNLLRGMEAVAQLDAASFATPTDYLKKVGMTLVSTVGGASGPLYGTFFVRFGLAVDGLSDLDAEACAAGLAAGIAGIQQRGKAERGDKTMLDALLPAAEAFQAAGHQGVAVACDSALAAAETGRDATISLVATKGRASYLGERSAGHQDPGATSATLLMACAAEVFGA